MCQTLLSLLEKGRDYCSRQLSSFFSSSFIAPAEGFLDDYISQQPLEARWTLLESKMTGVGV